MIQRLAGAPAALLFFCACILNGSEVENGQFSSRLLKESQDPQKARLSIWPKQLSPYAIPARLTGKFAEHLGANIYHGMDAQILRNPSLSDYPFATGGMSPDGVARFLSDEDRIDQELARQADRAGWKRDQIDRMRADRKEGLATWWMRLGKKVQCSPDTGAGGGRAQRVETALAATGIAQWIRLPLHRINQYEFEIFARSPQLAKLTVSLWKTDSTEPIAEAVVEGLSPHWTALRGRLELPLGLPQNEVYLFSITAGEPGGWVISRVLLRPADHILGADPEVVRFLKDTHLSILRWPGGNFVSGYHWEDGIGPLERRPAKPNYAWGGVEPNYFGTDEFINFCLAVGCEPMICVNAGDGTPAEAARWVEYCNGSADTPMGALRAANGHSEPYRITYWEVGNELWGKWQYHWTTAQGYSDRFQQFCAAMRAADPSIRLLACGAPVLWGKSWNDTLIRQTAPILQVTTDHPLIGGNVSPETEPLDVYRDFMAVPEILESKWLELEHSMRESQVKEPRLAITELQLFAHISAAAPSNAAIRLKPANLVNPSTLAEGLYDVLIYHAAIRLAPFVEMVTHSATVNHGGGLRKEREKVYANPCYYAQKMFGALTGAVPVKAELTSPMVQAPKVLPDLKTAGKKVTYSSVDALAAATSNGELWVSIVHRGTDGPIQITVDFNDFTASPIVEVEQLAAETPWTGNTLDAPDKVRSKRFEVPGEGNEIRIQLPSYSYTRLHLTSAKR